MDAFVVVTIDPLTGDGCRAFEEEDGVEKLLGELLDQIESNSGIDLDEEEIENIRGDIEDGSYSSAAAAMSELSEELEGAQGMKVYVFEQVEVES
jgi:hypothetical protein